MRMLHPLLLVVILILIQKEEESAAGAVPVVVDCGKENKANLRLLSHDTTTTNSKPNSGSNNKKFNMQNYPLAWSGIFAVIIAMAVFLCCACHRCFLADAEEQRANGIGLPPQEEHGDNITPRRILTVAPPPPPAPAPPPETFAEAEHVITDAVIVDYEIDARSQSKTTINPWAGVLRF